MASRFLLILFVGIAAAAHVKHDWKRTYELLKERRFVKDSPFKRQSRTSLGSRLVGGSTIYEGRLEVYKQPHGWGTVCDDWFGEEEAQVACRMLGFTGGEAMFVGFEDGTGNIVLDNVNCEGTEADLWDCDHNEWGDNDCSHYEDVGIRCEEPATTEPPTTEPTAVIRLVNGSSPTEGRVEVYHDGEWGTVCDDWWESADAEVACRQLGYSGGEARQRAPFGQGHGRIWLDNVECSGHESALDECSHNAWGDNNCGHSEDGGVVCDGGSEETSPPPTTTATTTTTTQTPIPTAEIRLVGGTTSTEGRVEVLHDGEWGTVCDDWWQTADAVVACRHLGYSGGEAKHDAYFGQGEGRIWLDDVECLGHERELPDCTHRGWGNNNCGHGEDAGVVCDGGSDETNPPPATTQAPIPIAEIRLVGGDTPTEGRVEVLHDGEWGTVCDDWWETADAVVACRHLGYSGGEAKHDAYFGQGEGRIWLDDVECLGHERELPDCTHRGWGNNNCGHGEDAGVVCDGGSEETIPPPATTEIPIPTAEIRLVGGDIPTQGRVEVLHDGEWGTVCDDWWEFADAQVVCRQMGYRGGEPRSNAAFGEGSGNIWLDNVGCNGDETQISDCTHSGWGQNDCGHYEDAGVVCDSEEPLPATTTGPESSEATIRLVNGDSENEGRVEVLHDGVWGTVCDDGWDNVDATVVCRSLGYQSGIALVDNEFGDGVDPIWLDEVECTGTESRLEDCPKYPWGEEDCYHFEDAGVRCN